MPTLQKTPLNPEHSGLGLKVYPLAFSERSLSAFCYLGKSSESKAIIPKIYTCFSWSRPPHWRVYTPLEIHMSFGQSEPFCILTPAY